MIINTQDIVRVIVNFIVIAHISGTTLAHPGAHKVSLKEVCRWTFSGVDGVNSRTPERESYLISATRIGQGNADLTVNEPSGTRTRMLMM